MNAFPFPGDWQPLTDGLSGAAVYRCGDRILKRFILPRSREPLRAWQWLPYLHFTSKLLDFKYTASFVWELSTWQPGQPVATWNPTQTRNAMTAINAIHSGWAASRQSIDTLGARIDYVNTEVRYLRTLSFEDDLAREAQSRLQELPRLSDPTCQFIHGDLHRGHVLFKGDDVTGIIDFSNIKRDHPMIDYARAGLYVNDLAADLGRVIATGTICHWLRRLSHPRAVERLQAAMAVVS